jgi:hypothetical protein
MTSHRSHKPLTGRYGMKTHGVNLNYTVQAYRAVYADKGKVFCAPALAVARSIYAACLCCATRLTGAKLAARARAALLSHTEAHAAIAHMPRLAV